MRHSRKSTARMLRYTATLGAFVLAAAGGVALSFFFADGLKPGPSLTDDSVATVEALRLPVGARRFSDITSFIISVKSADDYGRVYLNNYVVLNREATNLFYTDRDPEGRRHEIERKMVDRKVNKMGDLEAREYLQRGLNIMVVELENAVGGCEMRADISANGMRLEHFPQQLPDNFQVDQAVVNPSVYRKLKIAQSKGSGDPRFVPDPLDNVLCARRVFEFHLQ